MPWTIEQMRRVEHEQIQPGGLAGQDPCGGAIQSGDRMDRLGLSEGRHNSGIAGDECANLHPLLGKQHEAARP